tara:strand:+ start:1230 stop:1508 length:279 start_codon:yes stop_codon:yes gene_type:complete
MQVSSACAAALTIINDRAANLINNELNFDIMVFLFRYYSSFPNHASKFFLRQAPRDYVQRYWNGNRYMVMFVISRFSFLDYPIIAEYPIQSN